MEPRHARQHGVGGTVRVFAAELLIIPSGILTAALLTRALGTTDFALFALAATAIAWVEWSVTMMFSRAALKLVAEADDWRPVGDAVLRAHVAGGILAMFVIWIVAIPVSRALDAPGVAIVLALFAVDIPIFTAAQAHRVVLVGRGLYRERAIATAARWISRLAYVTLFIAIDASVASAVAGSIAASVTELIVARRYIRPRVMNPSAASMRNLLEFAAPLFIFALCARVVDKVDLFALRALGESLATAGVYSAAQNLSLGPGLFAAALSPVLIASMTRQLRDGEQAAALLSARNSLRAAFLLLPFAALISGSAPELTSLLYGRDFIDGALPLSILIIGAVGFVIQSVAVAIIVVTGRPQIFIFLGVSMVVAALAGHLIFVARFGAAGASSVTAFISVSSALVSILIARHVSGVAVPIATLARSTGIAVGAFFVADAWASEGSIILVQLTLLSAAVLAAILLLREMSASELGFFKRMVTPGPRVSAAGSA